MRSISYKNPVAHGLQIKERYYKQLSDSILSSSETLCDLKFKVIYFSSNNLHIIKHMSKLFFAYQAKA